MLYQDKHVLVLGLGESGLAMALWLARSGARVRVADTRTAPERLPQLRQAVPTAEFVPGEFTPALLDGVDFVAVSPGLAPNRELAQLLPAAQEKNLPVWGEIELFAQALAALKEERGYAPKLLAVTGTNGKTTVTSLTGKLCAAAGLSVRVAGNISPAALDVLREAVDADDELAAEHEAAMAEVAAAEAAAEEAAAAVAAAVPDGEGEAPQSPAPQPPAPKVPARPTALPQCWVLELSSFQLFTTHSLQADAATVLNVTQDHLDWHGDMDAYAAAKARIFGKDTVRVLNRDDARCMRMAEGAADVASFGTDAPQAPDSLGLLTDHGMSWLALAEGAEEDEGGGKRRRKQSALVEQEVFVKRLMPADALKIRGQHNATNALAALALCRAIGLPLAPLLHAARQYQGEPHRVELVATLNGVEYFDDSKGTNVGATVAALAGLGAGKGAHLLLIAGGDGKGQDFAPLADPVARHVKAVMLIGRDAPGIRAALENVGVPLVDCATLPEAVDKAAAAAQPGDAVLLSPACASLDMFKNYAERAQVFVDAVREVALARGEVPL